MSKTVFVCCHQTCPKQGALKILREFQKYEDDQITVVRSGCLGECGSGPMVKVMPDKAWYNNVQVKNVQAIAEQHLQQGKPVKKLLYWKYHEQKNYVTVWISIFLGFWASMILIFWLLASHTSLNFGF
ncbi:(2Fe-2S) ferredoxin domain-containing protein [[Limnothrix rosea] IAM M-220]|uniref:(2Fe-2S) ferredoxin domain-containing protein n=1 Tax=[Limnothrix rosea] IAM M-220 TaxID=454133 RepID=UPI000961AB0F|nr:(2Fe-2S) ferredoxin domain-containing protein [[Limnothrix rosea] IAM M-220]OKH19285.1 hypothetical protein NIES208_03270 [[Limnothrix rosea] IAM M-220]